MKKGSGESPDVLRIGLEKRIEGFNSEEEEKQLALEILIALNYFGFNVEKIEQRSDLLFCIVLKIESEEEKEVVLKKLLHLLDVFYSERYSDYSCTLDLEIKEGSIEIKNKSIRLKTEGQGLSKERKEEFLQEFFAFVRFLRNYIAYLEANKS